MGRASNSFTLSMTKDESEFGASVYVCGVCVCRNLSATRTMGVVLNGEIWKVLIMMRLNAIATAEKE